MSYMFNVVSDKAHSVHDDAESAIRKAMGILYLSPSRFNGAKETLERGEKFSYGFNQVEIVPVQKRRLTA